MGYGQYPTNNPALEAASFFRLYHQDKAAREYEKKQLELQYADLKRQKKRDKSLSKSTAARLKQDQEEHDYRMRQDRIMNAYRVQQEQRLQEAALADSQKNRQAQLVTMLNIDQGITKTVTDTLKPGETMGKEDYEEFVTRKMDTLTAAGFDPTDIANLSFGWEPPKKPEDEEDITPGQRLSLASTMIAHGAVDAAEKLISDAGVEGITVDMFKDIDPDLPFESKAVLGKVIDHMFKGQISPDDYRTALERIEGGVEASGIMEGINVDQPDPEMGATDYSAMMRYYSDEGNYEAMAELTAQRRSDVSDVEYRHVFDNKGALKSGEWVVVTKEQAQALRAQGRISASDMNKFEDTNINHIAPNKTGDKKLEDFEP
jgi:hypothetical protein